MEIRVILLFGYKKIFVTLVKGGVEFKFIKGGEEFRG